MKKYITVSRFSAKEVEDEVNGLLDKGYTPLGGISVTFVNNPNGVYFTFIQALLLK